MRDNTISIAKSIGIILMVIGHSSCPDMLHNFIYQFHIPLFFFFSGYCFKDKYLNDFRTYSLKRLSGIYLPYIKYAFLFLVLHNLFFHLNIYNGLYGYNGQGLSLYTFSDMARRAWRIATSMSGEEQLLGGYWFMKILLLASFLGYGAIKLLKSTKLQIGGLVILYAITVALTRQDSLSSFWTSVQLTCFATFFFMAGKILSVHRIPEDWWFTAICFAGVTALSIINPTGFADKNNILLYAIGAMFGILATKNISTHIQKMPLAGKLLTFIGNSTLTILTWHFLCFKLISLLIIKSHHLPIELLASFPVITEYAEKGWWIAYSIVGTAVPVCIAAVEAKLSCRKRISLFIFCLYLAAIGYTCFTDPEGMPHLPEIWTKLHIDKLIHFVMFAPFPILAYQLFRNDDDTMHRRIGALVLIILTGCGIAIGTEYLQSTLEYRSAEVGDLLADAAGIAIGGVCTALAFLFKRKR